MMRLRVLLAEDHQTVREGLRMIIDQQPDMKIVGEAANGNEVLKQLQELQPQIIVMDISMPGMNGLKATRRVKELNPDIGIVALSRHKESGYVQELLHAGASAYVLKQSASDELLRAIRAVSSGKRYLDPEITDNVIAGRAPKQFIGTQTTLTNRETEVIRLIARGYSNKEIAFRLDISIKTVEAHKSNSLKKLGLASRIDIVNFAMLQGWLESS